jgi:transcriptional regulator GlxA family with amidase domain
VQARYDNMHIRTMLRVFKFQIDWTPIAYATLASIKVRDARDNMVLMASNRFMKQIMNAYCTLSAMVR